MSSTKRVFSSRRAAVASRSFSSCLNSPSNLKNFRESLEIAACRGRSYSAAASQTADGNVMATQRFSPAARHMLESHSVDSNKIKGTSKGGRISKEDVVLAMKNGTAVAGSAQKHSVPKAAAAPAASAAMHSPSVPTPVVHAPTTVLPPIDFTKEAPANSRYTDIPNSNMRKIIAKRLTESKSTVPHFFTSIECEIDGLMALRKAMKKDLDVNVSVNDLVIRSAALALRDVPEANAKWNRSTGVIDASNIVDISVAVATPNGLITPIVTGADKRGLANINKTVKDLATRAKDGKLKPEEFMGGSFSVSNLGMFGISSFTAVVNPPQACILAVGAGISRVAPPTTAGGKPRVVTTVTVQLSGDRRVVDEALAAQYLQVFRSYLSNPSSMLL